MPERFQQEIEKILEQTEDLLPSTKPDKPPKQQNYRSRSFSSSLKNSISVGRLTVLVILFFLTFALLFDATLGMVFFWGGLILGILGYAFILVRTENSSSRPHWRGKLVEYDDNHREPTWLGRIWKRFNIQ